MLRNQVFVLDHMYMSLFSTCGWILRLGVTVALLDVDPSGARRCWRSSRCPTVPHLDVAACRRTCRAGTRRAVQPSGASSVHHRHHGRARKGSARHRHRRASGARAPCRVGALVRPGGRRPLGLARVARARLGDLRPALMSARSSSWPRTRRARRARCCWCWLPARGCRPTSAPPSARSDSCAASGWMARAASPGSRITPPRSPPPPICRCPPRLRRGIRFEHVSFAYPGTDRASCSRTCHLTLPAGAVVAIVGENGAARRRW